MTEKGKGKEKGLWQRINVITFLSFAFSTLLLLCRFKYLKLNNVALPNAKLNKVERWPNLRRQYVHIYHTYICMYVSVKWLQLSPRGVC